MKYSLSSIDVGRERIVRKFLLLPRVFHNSLHWMKFANVVEEVKEWYRPESGEHGTFYYEWKEVCTTNREPTEE